MHVRGEDRGNRRDFSSKPLLRRMFGLAAQPSILLLLNGVLRQQFDWTRNEMVLSQGEAQGAGFCFVFQRNSWSKCSQTRGKYLPGKASFVELTNVELRAHILPVNLWAAGASGSAGKTIGALCSFRGRGEQQSGRHRMLITHDSLFFSLIAALRNTGTRDPE